MHQHDFETLIDRSAQGSAKWAAMRRANPDVPVGIAPFSVADLDLPNAPEIMQGLKAFLDHAVLGYTAPTPAYIDAVIAWMQRRHEWSVSPESLVQTNGVVPALATAVRAFTAAGDGVIVQPPVYYPFYHAIERNQRRVVRNPLVIEQGRYRMDLDHLRAVAADPANTMMILCSPHNPVGRVWTWEELTSLAQIVIEHDLILISDDIHFDLILPDHHHIVISTLGPEIARRSVVCTAPSKTFNLAGMATSNLVIEDGALRSRFVRELEAQGQFFLNTLGYKACELAYTQGEAWLDGLLQLIARNHALVRRFMAEHLPAVTVFDLEGTYLQWMDFRALGRSPRELKTLHQRQALVFFDEGGVFGVEGDGFERMNLATPGVAVEAALKRLAIAHE
ncbi:MAG TPA: MalY/PatB family protein [Chiayiivirga sp.]|nr:MalY/PatB family protein [Chiayiivirga sp.]